MRLPDGVYGVDYVRRLEEALIRTVRAYGLPAMRVAGRSGVWLPAAGGRPERKVVAIGILAETATAVEVHLRDLLGFAPVSPPVAITPGDKTLEPPLAVVS